jgi:hypothetical protein
MMDREKVLAVLTKRFPHAEAAARAAAANAILGLGDEWEEVTGDELSHLAQQMKHGNTFRLFRRRVSGKAHMPFEGDDPR